MIISYNTTRTQHSARTCTHSFTLNQTCVQSRPTPGCWPLRTFLACACNMGVQIGPVLPPGCVGAGQHRVHWLGRSPRSARTSSCSGVNKLTFRGVNATITNLCDGMLIGVAHCRVRGSNRAGLGTQAPCFLLTGVRWDTEYC